MLVSEGVAQKVVCSDCRTVIGVISETLGKTGHGPGGTQAKSFAERVGQEPLEKAN